MKGIFAPPHALAQPFSSIVRCLEKTIHGQHAEIEGRHEHMASWGQQLHLGGEDLFVG